MLRRWRPRGFKAADQKSIDLVAPGQVDIAYYGTTTPGDPNEVNATWNVYLAKRHERAHGHAEL